jgi:hypothetical protein
VPFVTAAGVDVHYVEHGPGTDTAPPTAVLPAGPRPALVHEWLDRVQESEAA